MVPMTANSASKLAIGIGWPLQKAQSIGAKAKPKQRISPTKGCDMGSSSVPAREDAYERNAKADAQRRHQISMALIATYGAAGARSHHLRLKRRGVPGRGIQEGTARRVNVALGVPPTWP